MYLDVLVIIKLYVFSLVLIDLRDDEFKTIGKLRYGFYHKRSVHTVESQLLIGLYHEILEKGPGLFGTESKFAELYFIIYQILRRYGAADLGVADSF